MNESKKQDGSLVLQGQKVLILMDGWMFGRINYIPWVYRVYWFKSYYGYK